MLAVPEQGSELVANIARRGLGRLRQEDEDIPGAAYHGDNQQPEAHACGAKRLARSRRGRQQKGAACRQGQDDGRRPLDHEPDACGKAGDQPPVKAVRRPDGTIEHQHGNGLTKSERNIGFAEASETQEERTGACCQSGQERPSPPDKRHPQREQGEQQPCPEDSIRQAGQSGAWLRARQLEPPGGDPIHQWRLVKTGLTEVGGDQPTAAARHVTGGDDDAEFLLAVDQGTSAPGKQAKEAHGRDNAGKQSR